MDYDRLRELQAKFDENPRRYFAPLANEYRKGGNPKRAIEICRAHLAQMPGHMSGQVVYGQSLFEGGEFDEARKVFEGALLLDPENLIALRSLGDLALQAGDNAEARSWYTKLLEADPKDASVISLLSQIDDAGVAVADSEPTTEEAAPTTTSEFTVDFSFVDKPPGLPTAGASATAHSSPDAEASAEPASSTSAQEPVTATSESARAEPEADVQQTEPPFGLEHHYPTESVAAPQDQSPTERMATPTEPMGPDRDTPVAAQSASPEPMGPDRDALDTWLPPASAPVHEAPPEDEIPDERPLVSNQPEPPPLFGTPSRAPDPQPTIADVAEATPASFAGSNPEPFVNETMAQLYLQQGYKQLALRVYRQLSERKPDEQSFKDRIAEIEASQAAPETVPEARRDDLPSVESPTPEPAAPRSPSTESPVPHGPGSQPASVETPGYDRSTIDSQPSSPSSEPDSVESPVREEPRAEPEGIAARQPSIREFFATLGRRRPPRPTPAPARAWNEQPSAAIAAAAPDTGNSASLDSVFAGAKVSATDARAASTLAGAFSTSARSTNAPSPAANPTPRANPRLQAQESEEDVAKFRAWLDGLTGE
jgi:tetratricopeptide (TPR) repeat protein